MGHAAWKELVNEALIELDRDSLKDRLVAAERAISKRQREIGADNSHHTERLAMEDALVALQILKREAYGPPEE
jgi:hypothetical protein